MTTAYEHFLYKYAKEQVTEFNSIIDLMSFFLYMDCTKQNEQAFNCLGQTGDESFTQESFTKAANIIVNKIESQFSA